MLLPLLAFFSIPQPSFAQPLPEAFYVADTTDFQAELKKHVLSVPAWAAELQKSGFDFLCLGESHYSEFRELYGSLVFKHLPVNHLAIEATPEEAKKVTDDFRQNGKVELLGGDFSPVLKALQPEAQVRGIEPTKEDDLERLNESIKLKRNRITRDGFLARNAAALIEKAPLVAVYGALHCAAESNGLGFATPFFRILKNLNPGKKLVSVLLVPENDRKNILRIFADSFGFTKTDIVIKDARRMDPKLYNYRTDLKQIFRSYDVILLPRSTAPIDDGDR